MKLFLIVAILAFVESQEMDTTAPSVSSLLELDADISQACMDEIQAMEDVDVEGTFHIPQVRCGRSESFETPFCESRIFIVLPEECPINGTQYGFGADPFCRNDGEILVIRIDPEDGFYCAGPCCTEDDRSKLEAQFKQLFAQKIEFQDLAISCAETDMDEPMNNGSGSEAMPSAMFAVIAAAVAASLLCM